MSMYGMNGGTDASERIMGAITRNPEGLLLLAAGVALMMRGGRRQPVRRNYPRGFPESRAAERQHFHSQAHGTTGVGERVGEAARRAGEYVSEVTDKVSETAGSYASSAAEYADDAARIAAEQSRRMADQARESTDYIVREQPWAVALAGLVAGAAVAAVFPPTRFERRTLGEVGERLRSAAGSVGEQVMKAGKQAGERLSEVAEERGLTSEGLKDAAREVGETFSSALTGEEANAAQTSNRPRAAEEAGPRTQARHAQAGPGTQSHKGNRPTGGSSGAASSGGRR